MSSAHDLIFPDELIPTLIANYREWGADPMPDEETLRQLIKLAFFASLEHEEGRPVRFSLGLVSPDHLDRQSEIGWMPQRFHLDARRPATVAELVRLAPAADPRQTVIALLKAASGLQIAGLVHTGLGQYRLARRESILEPLVLLWYPRITVLGAGSLGIGTHDANFVNFCAGRDAGRSINILRDSGPVLAQINALADANMGNGGDRAREMYARMVGHILQRIVDGRHGGTFVILGDHKDASDAQIKYRTRSDALKLQFLDCWKASLLRESSESEAPHSRRAWVALRDWHVKETNMYDAISATADLAKIDGAVLLGPDISISGFGAMFRWNENTPKALRALDCEASERRDIDLAQYGSRHRSAASFCNCHPKSIGFVVSEDGALTCMMRPNRDDALLVWRPVSVAWWAPTRPAWKRPETEQRLEEQSRTPEPSES